MSETYRCRKCGSNNHAHVCHLATTQAQASGEVGGLVEVARARADGHSTIWNDHSLFAELADTILALQAREAALVDALVALLEHFNDDGLHKMRPDLPLGHQAMTVQRARALLTKAAPGDVS